MQPGLCSALFRPPKGPGINRLIGIERHGDHAPAHQFNQGLIGVTAFDNRDQRIVTCGHQQELLHHECFSATRLGHNEHVGVA